MISAPALRERETSGTRGTVHPFTPKSDRFQISPVASAEIKNSTVWRTWLFIAYSDGTRLYCQFSLPHLYILEVALGSGGLKCRSFSSPFRISKRYPTEHLGLISTVMTEELTPAARPKTGSMWAGGTPRGGWSNSEKSGGGRGAGPYSGRGRL